MFGNFLGLHTPDPVFIMLMGGSAQLGPLAYYANDGACFPGKISEPRKWLFVYGWETMKEQSFSYRRPPRQILLP